MDERFAQLFRIRLIRPVSTNLNQNSSGERRGKTQTHLECKHIVGKYDHLVASALMIIDQELTCLDLVRVHGVQEDAFARRIP